MSDIGLPPEAPPVPSRRNDQQMAFDTKTENYLVWQGTFRAWLGSFRDWVIGARAATLDARDDATAAALAAASAAGAAAGAANFAGNWSSLSGPLNKPASVKHNNRIWLLLNNLANVAASQPGVSADWTTGDSGELVQVVNANTTITPGPVYAVATAGVTVTMPASLQAGDMVHIRNVSGGQVLINWATHTVKGRAPQSPMPVPVLRGVSLVYAGGTLT